MEVSGRSFSAEGCHGCWVQSRNVARGEREIVASERSRLSIETQSFRTERTWSNLMEESQGLVERFRERETLRV